MDAPCLAAIEGRRRVAIENVKPIVDCGRFAIKRLVGQQVVVSADVFADGHDVVRAVLLSRLQEPTAWHESPMSDLGNDRWQGEFTVAQIGRYEYTVEGWVDAFETWHRDLRKAHRGRTGLSRPTWSLEPSSSARLPSGPVATMPSGCGTGKPLWPRAPRPKRPDQSRRARSWPS